MRVANMLPDIQYQMQQSQQALATATEQVSTGLRVNQLSDDPAASANMVRSLAYSANVDQYEQRQLFTASVADGRLGHQFHRDVAELRGHIGHLGRQLSHPDRQ